MPPRASHLETRTLPPPLLGQETWRFQGHDECIAKLAVSPNSQIVASIDSSHLRFWDLDTKTQLRSLLVPNTRGRVNGVAFSPDGSVCLCGTDDGSVHIWDCATGIRKDTFHFDPLITSVAFSLSGSLFAVASCTSEQIVLFDLTSRKPRWTHVPPEPLSYPLHIVFHPDNEHVLAACVDEQIRVWDLRSGKVTKTFRSGGNALCSAAISPDGKQLLGIDRQAIFSWDWNTGQRREFRRADPQSHFTSAAFSPDGRFVATSNWNKSMELWGAHSLRWLGIVGYHAMPVRDVAFTSNGKHLISCSGGYTPENKVSKHRETHDFTVRLWDIDRAIGCH